MSAFCIHRARHEVRWHFIRLTGCEDDSVSIKTLQTATDPSKSYKVKAQR